MGAGKSLVGPLLAERLGLAFVDLDRLVEARACSDISTLFEQEGEAGFRVREQSALREVLSGEGLVLACGGGTPCEPGALEALNAWGTTVFLQVPFEVLQQRVAGIGRPLWSHRNRSLLEFRMPIYEQADLAVDGTAVPVEVAEAIMAGLSEGAKS
jgi:shikimate kinase